MTTFTIDDEPTTPEIDNAPASVRRAIKALDALPHGKLLKRGRLAELAGLGYETFQRMQSHPALEPYRHLVVLDGGRRYVFGSRETIEEYRAYLKSREGAA